MAKKTTRRGVRKMKSLTKEEEREHPELAFRSYQCQAHYIRMKSKCKGCNCMVPGCEKVVLV